MNRFLIYLLIIFTYLGISKSFYPNKQVTISIPNKFAISSMFRNAPLSIILTDMDEVGLIMKTYLMKYMLISGYQEPISVTIKTNKKYWEESKEFIGMSIFRRKENEETSSTVPMPPGFHFIGDSSYGYWRINRKTKEKEWHFYRSSAKLKKYFSYGDYRPTHKMIKQARISLKKRLHFLAKIMSLALMEKLLEKIYPPKYLTRKSSASIIKNTFHAFFYITQIFKIWRII